LAVQAYGLVPNSTVFKISTLPVPLNVPLETVNVVIVSFAFATATTVGGKWGQLMVLVGTPGLVSVIDVSFV
jgi:hypothetical protein